MTDCVFCKIVKKEIPSKTVHEDGDFVAFRDVNPQAPVHILIVPKRHIPGLLDVQGGDAELLGRLLLLSSAIARKEGIAERGYRTLFNTNREAGQTVFHLHLHLIGGRPMAWPPG